nr:MAG TPA_asm: Protein of unknown function (DUF2615) [Caudoviricetes sp.]
MLLAVCIMIKIFIFGFVIIAFVMYLFCKTNDL